MKYPEALYKAVQSHEFPLLFATISGAHLYGFPSPDSDYDLRGVHILPITELVGLKTGEETIEISEMRGNIELDLVTHDIKKFILMMLKRNGYVLEQLLSPLIVKTSPEHEELKALAPGCITRHHLHHYRGFALTQWNLFQKEKAPRVKPLLYVYRVLLTGIHLMQSGKLEANLLKLNEEFCLPYIADLVERKVSSREKQTLADADMELHQREFQRLYDLLGEAAEKSKLPELPSTRNELDAFLKRVRLA